MMHTWGKSESPARPSELAKVPKKLERLITKERPVKANFSSELLAAAARLGGLSDQPTKGTRGNLRENDPFDLAVRGPRETFPGHPPVADHVRTVTNYGEDLLFNYGRLHALLRKEDARDEIHLSILPNPNEENSKIVRLRGRVLMPKEDSDDSDGLPKATFDHSSLPGTNDRQNTNPMSIDDDDTPVDVGTAVVPESCGSEYGRLDDSFDADNMSVELGDPPAAAPEPTPSLTELASTATQYIPLGLPRVGLVSYRHVCIEAIAHSISMQRYLDRMFRHDDVMNRVVRTPGLKFPSSHIDRIACHLRKVVGLILGEHGNNFDIDQFHNVVTKKYRRSLGPGGLEDPNDWRYNNNTHMDAGTAMRWFLELLSFDHNDLFRGRKARKPFCLNVKEMWTCAHCSGGSSQVRFQEHYVLTLRDDALADDLESAIRSTFAGKKNIMEACSSCGENTAQSVEQLVDDELPDLMVIQLGASDPKGKDITNKRRNVKYGNLLNFGQFTQDHEVQADYTLVAVIAHKEIHLQDAYWVVHVSRGDGVYRLDDNYIQAMDGEALCDPKLQFTDQCLVDGKPTQSVRPLTPFMLVYERVKDWSVDDWTDHSSDASGNNTLLASAEDSTGAEAATSGQLTVKKATLKKRTARKGAAPAKPTRISSRKMKNMHDSEEDE